MYPSLILFGTSLEHRFDLLELICVVVMLRIQLINRLYLLCKVVRPSVAHPGVVLWLFSTIVLDTFWILITSTLFIFF